MKKPEYLGEREFLAAIHALLERLSQNAALDALLPFSADASYQGAELGAVAVTCSIKAGTDVRLAPALYRFTVRVQVLAMDLEKLVLVGPSHEIEQALQKMAEPNAVHAFLLRIYRDLSELQER